MGGLPHHLLDRLQSVVMNAATRLVYRARQFDHITPLYVISSGCAFLSELRSGLLCWLIVANTALARHT